MAHGQDPGVQVTMVTEGVPRGLRWGMATPVVGCHREPLISFRTELGLVQPRVSQCPWDHSCPALVFAQGQTLAGDTFVHLPGSVQGDGDTGGLGQLGLCCVASVLDGQDRCDGGLPAH